MITHIALFKLKDGVERDAPETVEAERSARSVGENVPELVSWRTGWNAVPRDIAYDFAVVGVLADEAALQRYQDNPFHRRSKQQWQAISDWVVVDLADG